jgi:hypothetical protein
MPGCATGVPQLLSWAAGEGIDCVSQRVPADVAAAVDFVVVLGGAAPAGEAGGLGELGGLVSDSASWRGVLGS